MDDGNSFTDRIQQIRAKKEQELRQSFHQRDRLLSQFEKTWEPLITHIKDLAKKYLPPDKRVKIELGVSAALSASLIFTLQQDGYHGKGETLPETPRDDTYDWSIIDHLDFSNFYHRAETDRDFQNQQAAENHPPEFAFKHFYKNTFLYPTLMAEAKEMLEEWLGTQIALDFDQGRIYPNSTFETIVKRSNSPADSTPK